MKSLSEMNKDVLEDVVLKIISLSLFSHKENRFFYFLDPVIPCRFNIIKILYIYIQI
jgi:hypothetical protein